jgi:hypothetical protein
MKIAKKDLWILLVVLITGLVNGLLFVYLVPPWQHYDEPNHFEYSWLIASRGKLPKTTDYDQSMRREVALSMIEHGFFKKMDFQPNLDDDGTPIWIGQFTQLSNPPIYYQLAAAILKGMITTTTVTSQLYAARLFSLFLYLISLAAAWGVAAELTPPGHWMRLLLPISIALLPAYTDLMTAMNSDVGAVAIFSIFTWASIRMVHKGISVLPVVVALSAGILGFWIKETVYVSLPLFLVALLLSVSNGKNRWMGVTLVGLALVGSIFALFSWGDAAWWARRTAQGGATRHATASAPLGEYALQLQFRPGAPRTDVQQIIQLIPPAEALKFQGKQVSVGAWMWASQPVEGRPLILTIDDGKQVFYETINLGKSPVFHAFTVSPKGNTARAWLTLAMPTRPKNPVTIYYDGVVVVEGAYPLDQFPVFEDEQAIRGTWGGQPFTNLARNGSAERAWPEVRQWADALGTQYLPDHTRPSWIMAIFLDRKAAGWYHDLTALRLFRTFWAVFGWGNVALASGKPYRILAVVSAIGLIGAVLALLRRRRSINWSTVLFMGLVLLGIWGPSFVRGMNYIIYNPYFPVARYAYPCIIVTMLVLMVGWGEVFHLFKKRLRLPSWAPYGLALGFFFLLDVLALVTIANYYRS